jgi:hypothetical protein
MDWDKADPPPLTHLISGSGRDKRDGERFIHIFPYDRILLNMFAMILLLRSYPNSGLLIHKITPFDTLIHYNPGL